YLPTIRRLATKAPMESLLKRARSAGVSILLATQTPGDFDYKCRENVLTWLVGKVREVRAVEKLAAVLGGATDRRVPPGPGVGRDPGPRPPVARGAEQLPEGRILELARQSASP